MAFLVVIGHFNFLLFHSLAELFAVVVAWALFLLVWNTRHHNPNHALVFLGIAYLYVGFLDLLHTLAYSGMGVFPGRDANLPTQLWMAARFMEASALTLYPLALVRRFRMGGVAFVYGAITGILTLLIFHTSLFPDCYRDGEGLTRFKIIGEWVIVAALSAALFQLFRRRSQHDGQAHRLVIYSLGTTILSELVFTLYVDVHGWMNMIGHLLKTASILFLYQALVAEALRRPFDVLFRDHKEALEALRASETRYRNLFERSNDAIFIHDDAGRFLDVNQRACDLLGYERGELLAMDTTQCHPDHTLPELEACFSELQQKGHMRFETQFLRRDGEIIDVEISVRPVPGTETVYQALTRSIAERKRLERRLIEIADEERKHIGEELHEGVCLELTGIERMAKTLEERLSARGEDALKKIATNTRQGVNRVWGNACALAKGLLPLELNGCDLDEALTQLADHMGTQRGVNVYVDVAETSGVLSETESRHLYRIALEAVANAINHGQALRVSVMFHREKDSGWEFLVTDNGRGFSPTQSAVANSIGISLMRYRAGMLGAALRINSDPGGTTVSCRKDGTLISTGTEKI